jgi:hypothetical protein
VETEIQFSFAFRRILLALILGMERFYALRERHNNELSKGVGELDLDGIRAILSQLFYCKGYYSARVKSVEEYIKDYEKLYEEFLKLEEKR